MQQAENGKFASPKPTLPYFKEVVWKSDYSSEILSPHTVLNTIATPTALAGELCQFHKLFHKYVRLIKKIFAEHFNNGWKIPLKNSGTWYFQVQGKCQVPAEAISWVRRQELMAREGERQQICHKASKVE